MLEEDQLKAALLDWEGEGGSAGSPASERARASPRLEPIFDSRIRRGSLGPAPRAAALGEAASNAEVQAHLKYLLDGRRSAQSQPVDPAELPGEMRLGPHEDIERLPDGVPHLVIGLTALFSVLFAGMVISIIRSGPTSGRIAAIALLMVAIPVLVIKLGAKAERDRDHDHPSR